MTASQNSKDDRKFSSSGIRLTSSWDSLKLDSTKDLPSSRRGSREYRPLRPVANSCTKETVVIYHCIAVRFVSFDFEK